MSDARKARNDDGFLSVEYMVSVALSLAFLVMMVNFVVLQYGRGVVRASADEGARAGARVSADAVASCTDRGHQVLRGLGKLATVQYSCSIQGQQMVATADAKFTPWFPGVPTFSENATAYSVKEVKPK
jgi:hypothetical protein